MSIVRHYGINEITTRHFEIGGKATGLPKTALRLLADAAAALPPALDRARRAVSDPITHKVPRRPTAKPAVAAPQIPAAPGTSHSRAG